MTLTPTKWPSKSALVPWAFKEGARKADPALLEPYMSVEVEGS